MMKIYKEKITDFSEIEYRRAFDLMNDERKGIVERMKFENDRKLSVLGEYLARRAISEISGIAENLLEFARTENGKPYCKNVDIHFNISHSQEMVVCAVDEKPIGVDVEFIRNIDYRITRFALCDCDMKYLENKNDDEKKLMFFRIWTAKEAYVKSRGMVLANIKDVSYDDIKENCITEFFDNYIITVYCGK